MSNGKNEVQFWNLHFTTQDIDYIANPQYDALWVRQECRFDALWGRKGYIYALALPIILEISDVVYYRDLACESVTLQQVTYLFITDL